MEIPNLVPCLSKLVNSYLLPRPHMIIKDTFYLICVKDYKAKNTIHKYIINTYFQGSTSAWFDYNHDFRKLCKNVKIALNIKTYVSLKAITDETMNLNITDTRYIYFKMLDEDLLTFVYDDMLSNAVSTLYFLLRGMLLNFNQTFTFDRNKVNIFEKYVVPYEYYINGKLPAITYMSGKRKYMLCCNRNGGFYRRYIKEK